MTTLEMRQKRARLIEQMKEAGQAADEARKANESARAAEKDAEFDRIVAEESELSKQIERAEQLDAAERRAAADHLEDLDKKGEKPKGSDETDYRTAFRNWFCRGKEYLTPEERALLEKRGTSDLVAGTPALGGYTVPTDLSTTLIEAMKDYSGIMQVADIRYTSSGNPLLIPTLDDTGTLAVKVAEAAAHTFQDLTYAQKSLDAYAYRSAIRISWELMQDSIFNMDTEMRRLMVPRFGRAINNTCTLGDGTGDPNGIVTAASAGKTAASTTAITFNEIIELIHTVDPAYRRSNTCGFMFHDNTLAAIKKLSIGTGDARPLWQPSVREGEPDRIEGYRYWINQDMDSALAASDVAMLFGDFSYYTIRMVQNLVIRRLDERYADNGLVGFIGFARWDGELLNTAAVKKYTMAAS